MIASVFFCACFDADLSSRQGVVHQQPALAAYGEALCVPNASLQAPLLFAARVSVGMKGWEELVTSCTTFCIVDVL
jgi:hypothetical protein